MTKSEEITKIIEKAELAGITHFGIIADSKNLEIGSYLDNSGEGTGAVTISYNGWDVEDIESDLKELDGMDGNRLLIGGDDSYDAGLGEKVIKNARVLYIFK